VNFKPKVSGREQYDNLRLTLVSGQYCSLQRSLLWSSYTGPSTSPPPVIAFLELLFGDDVHHHMAFNLSLHSILKSLSLYLDFHLWKQEDVRRKLLSFLPDLAHKKLVLFLVIIRQTRHECLQQSVSCLNLKVKSVDVCCVIGLECYKHF